MLYGSSSQLLPMKPSSTALISEGVLAFSSSGPAQSATQRTFLALLLYGSHSSESTRTALCPLMKLLWPSSPKQNWTSAAHSTHASRRARTYPRPKRGALEAEQRGDAAELQPWIVPATGPHSAAQRAG